MLLKIVVMAMTVIAAFAVMRSFRGGSARVKSTTDAAREAVRRRMAASDELRKCEKCGAYVSPTETCACDKT